MDPDQFMLPVDQMDPLGQLQAQPLVPPPVDAPLAQVPVQVPVQPTVAELQLQMAAMAEQLRQLQAFQVPPPANPRPVGSIPGRFSGNRQDFRSFVNQCQLYLAANAVLYNTDFKRVVFMSTLLDGSARDWSSPMIEHNDNAMNNYVMFLDRFRAAFDDPDRVRTAERKLRVLKQGNGSVVTYASDFGRIAADTEWNESAKIAQFRLGLSDEIKDDLCHYELPPDLQELMTLAHRIDVRLAERRHEKKFGSQAPIASAKLQQHWTDPSSHAHHYLPAQGHGKMEIGNIRKPLTEAQKEHRRRNGMCMYCGSSEHFVKDCPIKPAVKHLNNVRVEELNKVADDYSLFYLPCSMYIADSMIPAWSTMAMVDSGGMGNFIDAGYARSNSIPIVHKRQPIPIRSIDGKAIGSGSICHETVKLLVSIHGHEETIAFEVIDSPHYPVVLGLPWLKLHDPTITWGRSKIVFNSKHCQTHCQSKHGYSTAKLLATCLTTTGNLESNPNNDKFSSLPAKYHEFKDVFSEEGANMLPPHRPYDCAIEIEEGKSPPFGRIYNLSEKELLALNNYLKDNLDKGFIRSSRSPAAAPIFFVKKKDGSLRPVVDYRGLNKVTIKNRYPLPLVPGLIDRLRRAKIFTKLDLRSAYNLLRIRKGDEWKTAFRTRYGLFEYLVMPFGITGAPAAFQHWMNDTFRDLLDVYVIVFIDDILIFSENPDKHDEDVKEVLRRLRQHGLFSKLEKCEFDCDTVEFLGFVVSPQGISMSDEKVCSIKSWPKPQSVRDVQVFLGFTNAYRRFCHNYAQMAKPLNKLTCKDTPFVWSEEADVGFENLKATMITAPVLAHPNPDAPFVVEVDASNYGLGCILSQKGSDGLMHPCAFHSRSLSRSERNYDVYDKELLAVKVAFEVWRHYLEGANHQVSVLTDHCNLLHFRDQGKILSQRQARWSLFFARFDFVLTYRPGQQDCKADALSRRADYRQAAALSDGDTVSTDSSANSRSNEPQSILKPCNIKLNLVERCNWQSDFAESLRSALATDNLARKVFSSLQLLPQSAATTNSNDSNIATDKFKIWSVKEGFLLRKDLIYVPESMQLAILQSRHDSPTAGHFGIRKTLELMRRDYWWPNMARTVKVFVSSCDTCCRSKNSHHRPYGLLQPLPTPPRAWSSVSLDFITDLPLSKGNTVILTIVDRLTKMSHFIPLPDLPTAEQTADAFLANVFKLHGLPDDLVSDRGSQFTSKFWQQLFHLLGTKVKLSTAFHPETDGQTERINQVVEQYLRCFISYSQDDWCDWLPLAEFCHNNTVNASTQISPFFANFGYHPRFDVTSPSTCQVPRAELRISQLVDMTELLSAHLDRAKISYKKHADALRCPAPVFAIGDLVWLLSSNIQSNRQSKKLDFTKYGPYKIKLKVSDLVYCLDLPRHMKIHPVFHVSLLEPYVTNSFPGRRVASPKPVVIEGSEEYVVSKVLDSKFLRGKLFYLVDWEGYGPEDRTWEPKANLANCPDLVTQFHRSFPNKPRS
jgi:hypothetical protein